MNGNKKWNKKKLLNNLKVSYIENDWFQMKVWTWYFNQDWLLLAYPEKYSPDEYKKE